MSINIPCFVFSFQVDRQFDYLNDLMLDTLGYDVADIVNKVRFEDILTGGSRILYTTHFYPVLLLEKEINEIFLSMRSIDGREVPILLNMCIVEKSGSQQVTGAGFKISKRNSYERRILEAKHEAEKALQENVLLTKTQIELEFNRTRLEDQLSNMSNVNKAQNDLNKILAHDLQEPIRKIQVFASRLDEVTQSTNVDDKSRYYVERILQTAKYSHELLKRLRSFHSIEYKELNYAQASIKTIIDEAMVETGNVELEIILQEVEIDEVYGDISQLTTLFSEIFKNAYQYRSQAKPPRIRISSSKISDNYHQALEGVFKLVDFMRIKIVDNAQGFASYAPDAIYKPFQNSTNTSGKGLGLAVCKKIVDLHKGRMSVQAHASGGSEFTIMLPINIED